MGDIVIKDKPIIAYYCRNTVYYMRWIFGLFLFCMSGYIVDFIILPQFESMSTTVKNRNKPRKNPLIPKTIYMTHKFNLCDFHLASWKEQKILHEDEKYYYYLKLNIEKIRYFNPDYEIQCFDDYMAYNYIKSKNETMAEYFKNEQIGMYKADIFRIFILYYDGGFYFDADMEPRMPLNNVIDKTATFSSAIDFFNETVFQSYLGAVAGSPILKINLDKFAYYYQNNIELPHNMGTVLLSDSLRNYTKEMSLQEIQKQKKYGDQKVQLFQEKIYAGRDSESVLEKRQQYDEEHGWMFQMALYDQQTKEYPFWGRISGYLNEDLRRKPKPSFFEHVFNYFKTDNDELSY